MKKVAAALVDLFLNVASGLRPAVYRTSSGRIARRERCDVNPEISNQLGIAGSSKSVEIRREMAPARRIRFGVSHDSGAALLERD